MARIGTMKPLKYLALAGLAVFLFDSIRTSLDLTWRSIQEASRLRMEDAATASRRMYGNAHWTGIEAIRREIPSGAAYYLVWNGVPGTDVWTRGDLAPRRPIFLGMLRSGRKELAVSKRPADGPPWVVLVRNDDQAPRLVTTEAFFREIESFRPEHEDGQLPCSLDVPAKGDKLQSPVVVRGWCQERGGRPCDTVRIFLDGEERTPDRFERTPRPDVEASVRGIGNCARAGFSADVELDPGEAGGHTMAVVFVTADGRWRRMGAVSFMLGAPGTPR